VDRHGGRVFIIVNKIN